MAADRNGVDHGEVAACCGEDALGSRVESLPAKRLSCDLGRDMTERWRAL